MAPKALFLYVLEKSQECVAHIAPEDLSKQTPCTDWKLKGLLNHMVYELLWAPDLLAGRTIAEVGDAYEGNVLDGDFKAAWEDAATKAKDAVELAPLDKIVHLSYADVSAQVYITELATDVLVHTWDAAKSVGRELQVDEAAAQAAYDYVVPRIEGYRDAGLVAAAVDVPHDAPVMHKLLGILGRDPHTTM